MLGSFRLFLGQHFLLPGFLAAGRTTHISGSAQVHCHADCFIGGHISVLAVLAFVVAGHLLKSQGIETAHQEQGKQIQLLIRLVLHFLMKKQSCLHPITIIRSMV